MNPDISFNSYSANQTLTVNTFNIFTTAGLTATLPDATKCQNAVIGVTSTFTGNPFTGGGTLTPSANFTKVLPTGTISASNPGWRIYRYNTLWFKSNGTKWVCITAGCRADAYVSGATTYIYASGV